jgi:amino acid adenylation domain-containing protein/thioester reductase-like protein
MYRCIHQWFEAQVSCTPNATALVFRQEQLSYQQLNQRVNALAHYLRWLQVGPETLVGLCLDRSPDQVIGLLAILKAGGAYVPLDPSYPRERIACILEDAQVSVLLTQQRYLATLPSHGEKVVCLDTHWHRLMQEKTENPESLSEPNHLAYAIYTSGSTGKPKGVMIEHRSLLSFVESAHQEYRVTASDRILQFASISFDAAVEEIFVTLTLGATLVLCPPEMLQTLPAFLKGCEDFRISVLDLPTAFWHKICGALPRLKLPECLRLVLIGGERVVPHWLALWQRSVNPQIRLVNAYGPTEATVVATCCDLSGPNAVPVGDRLVPIGKPLSHVQVYVLDAEGKPVKNGDRGELHIAGAGLARGYLNRPDITQQQFIHCAINGSHPIRLYKTGDLVRYRSDGNLEFLGRADHQEKIRGFRVELREIEKALEQHSAVKEAIVLAREDIPGEKCLVAYILSNLQEYTATYLTNQSQFEAEQIEQWRLIHNDRRLNSLKTHWDKTFNISGWMSSYTKELISEVEMQEWVDSSVARILDLRPQRVLEIGCGTGLMLFRIAPHCSSYVGTDFSESALEYVKQQLQNPSLALPQVTLEQRTADDFRGQPPHSVDTVILNSVIQYFPSINYLICVLEQSLQVIKPGGFIFIGDVRNYRLLEALATAVELSRAGDERLSEGLLQKIRHRINQEEELTIDPEFFWALPQALPQISQVQVLIKRGKFHNELTQFRYDVILQVGGSPPPPLAVSWLDWQEQDLSLAKLRQQLAQDTPLALGIRRVPNARVFAAVKAVELLHEPNCPPTIGALREDLANLNLNQSVNPEDLWQLAEELSYEVTLSWLGSRGDGAYTVLFQHRSAAFTELPGGLGGQSLPQLEPKFWHDYANDPLQIKVVRHLSRKLRIYLQQRLPDYMLPSAFVILNAFPLTPNGKVDRRALPKPATPRGDLEAWFVAPKTPLEQELAEIWSEVLQVNHIGINDNFFDLGGDSLRLIHLLSQIEIMYPNVLSFSDFFSKPTIAGIVEQIERSDRSESPTASDRMTLNQLHSEANCAIAFPASPPDTTHWTQPESIFLTGATGFIGAFVLFELLRQTPAHLYCLIRAQSPERAYQKLQATFERYLPGFQLPYSRIEPVLGDLSQPLLALSDAQFNQLASRLDVIHHLGANTNLLYPYQSLKAVNVGGTQAILDLASRVKLKPLHYISTLDVFESLAATGAATIYEQDSIAQGSGIAGGYAQSKWVAEQLVTSAALKGLPLCIYRPGMVTGHSQTGRSNPEDLMGRLVRSFIQLESAPDLDWKLDMTPVDYVSKAIVHISRQQASLGRAFHLVNPQPTPLSQVIELLTSFGHRIEPVSFEQWKTLLNNRQNALSALAPAILTPIGEPELTRLEIWLAGSHLFDCHNTRVRLEGSGLSCPSMNSRFIPWLSHQQADKENLSLI